MPECTFYCSSTKTLISREIRQDQQMSPGRTVRLHWCSHRHSPFPKSVALKVIATTSALPCRGDWDACTIPQDKRHDV